MLNFVLNLDVNVFLVVVIVISLISIIFYHSRLKQINKLIKPKSNKKRVKEKKSALNSFKEKLYIVLLVRGKERFHEVIFNLFLVVLFGIFMAFLAVESFPLAVGVPVLVFFFTQKILDTLIIDFDSVVRKNFSTLVNHIVKIFSKTNDLGVVLYESSRELDEPLRSLILKLSREIIVNSDERHLINFISTTENLWLHSFIFTLINYKETSSKSDVINNLLQLSSMIEKRNEISEKMVADRMPVIIINYMLLVTGIVIFIGNLVLNPIINTFIFTPFGMVCLLLGISAIFSTVIINMRLAKQ